MLDLPDTSMSEGTNRHQRSSAHPQESGRYGAVLTGDPSEIAPLRNAITHMAAVHGFEDRAKDLVLTLDELVANAREHGEPPITVSAWYDGRLVLTVSDVGPGFDPRQVPHRTPSKLNHRGRGLWIVRQLMDYLAVTSTSAGTTVRVEMTHEPQLGA